MHQNTMNCVFKTMNIALKMMSFASKRCVLLIMIGLFCVKTDRGAAGGGRLHGGTDLKSAFDGLCI